MQSFLVSVHNGNLQQAFSSKDRFENKSTYIRHNKMCLPRLYLNMVDSVIIGNSIPSCSVDEYSVQFYFHLKLFLLDRGFKYIYGVDVRLSQEARIEG